MKMEDRLAAISRHIALPTVEPTRETVSAGREARGIEARLSGELVGDATGACFVAHTVYPLDDLHGMHAFEAIRQVTGAHLAAISKDPELDYVDISRAVFLDTETTGLGMGAGTYVFLVGAGYVQGDQLHVKQFFLRGPGEELAFLGVLGDFLSNFAAIVTFNGKAFDWPLLENRYVQRRRRPPLHDPPHIDLLHPARRLWKRRLPSCALSSLETNILGVWRTHEDVPGWEIPARYFRYQRSGDGSELEGVFYHNLHDILSLVALTVHIDRVLADPFCGLLRDPLDFLCVGKALDRAGDPERGGQCYDEALRRGLSGEDREEGLIRLGLVHKRERRWDSALSIWEALVDGGGTGALIGRVELAKYYEHVERDYFQAIEHAQSALQLVELHESSWPEANRRDLDHRLGRLLGRTVRERSWVSRRG